MRIDDDEMRDLFRIESEERLQRLDEGLLKLEKTPDNHALLEEVFREAHSLKGAARMLGLSDIETVSHRLEDLLGAASKGKSVLSPELMDRIYSGLDAIRKLVHEAITGERAGVAVSDILKKLQPLAEPIQQNEAPAIVPAPISEQEETLQSREAGDREAGRTEEVPCQHIATMSSPEEVPDQPIAGTSSLEEIAGPGVEKIKTEEVPQSGIEEFRIETIRVKTKQLDTLMSQIGELTVSKIRINSRLVELEKIIALREDADKLLAALALGSSGLKPAGSRSEVDRLAFLSLKAGVEKIGELLAGLRSTLYDDLARLDFIANALDDNVRSIRLLPLSTTFSLFPRMIRDLARVQSKEVQLIIEGGETSADKRIIEEMKDPLMHIIRNAVDHGIEMPADREKNGKLRAGSIFLRAYQTASNIVIEVRDDGQGLDLEGIKRCALKRKLYREEELAAMSPEQIQALIFASGFSTSSIITDISGRGIGLDVVRANVERLKGTVQIESSSGTGCTIRILLPITLATTRVLIVSVNGNNYALPVEHVQTTIFVQRSEIFTIEGREAIVLDHQPVSIAKLADLLEVRSMELGTRTDTSEFSTAVSRFPCIVLSISDGRLAVLVDELVDEQEIVLKTQSTLLKRVRNVSGTTILGTGEACMVLNPVDLIKTVRKRVIAVAAEKPLMEEKRKKVILAVDDSLTTRTQIKRILDRAGYEVVTAVDGLDAYNKLGTRPFDALVSDITMPNMDGLTLAAKVREDRKYKEMPIVLVTALASEEDRRKGIEAGANAYITKPAFDEQLLTDTLRRLI